VQIVKRRREHSFIIVVGTVSAPRLVAVAVPQIPFGSVRVNIGMIGTSSQLLAIQVQQRTHFKVISADKHAGVTHLPQECCRTPQADQVTGDVAIEGVREIHRLLTIETRRVPAPGPLAA
jgi:hypothetical protein